MFEIDREAGTMMLTELAEGVSLEEVKAKTAAPFAIAENLVQMQA